MKPTLAIKAMLSKYADVDDFVHNGVQFKTNVSWVAPKAYLHILFPAVPADLLRQRTEELNISAPLREFYSQWNGASLFAGTLDIFGLLPEKYLLNRSDWRCRIPFNLITESKRWQTELDRRNMLCFGSYGFDRSAVCLSRNSGVVTAFAADRIEKIRSTWPNFDTFLFRELERLAVFFDGYGKCSFPQDALLPSSPI